MVDKGLLRLCRTLRVGSPPEWTCISLDELEVFVETLLISSSVCQVWHVTAQANILVVHRAMASLEHILPRSAIEPSSQVIWCSGTLSGYMPST